MASNSDSGLNYRAWLDAFQHLTLELDISSLLLTNFLFVYLQGSNNHPGDDMPGAVAVN